MFFVLRFLVVFWGLGAVLEGREKSWEAMEFEVRLDRGEAVFGELEAWVFEEGLGEAERRSRFKDAMGVVPSSMAHYDVKLRGVFDRFLEENGEFWWAWLEAGNYFFRVDGLPEILEPFEIPFEVSTGRKWGKEFGFYEKAEGMALASGAGGDALAEVYLAMAGYFWVDDRWEVEVGPELENLPEVRESLEMAKSDLERQLWCWDQALKVAVEKKALVKWELAFFWRDLLGVERVADAGYVYVEGSESEFDEEAPGELEVHTLKDCETLLVGPAGPVRVTLPEGCRFVEMMVELVNDEETPEELRWEIGEYPLRGIFENRRQFGRVLALVEQLGTREVVKRKVVISKEGQVSQITEGETEKIEIDWESDEDLRGGGTVAYGERPKVQLRSRGVDEVELELWRVRDGRLAELGDSYHDLEKMITGERSFLWETHDLDAYEENFGEELIEKVASWTVRVRKKPNYRQTLTEVELPVEEPGHYVVVRETKKWRELLPVRIHDVAILVEGVTNGGRSSRYFAVDTLTGELLEGVEMRGVVMWEDVMSYQVSDHRGEFLGLEDFRLGAIRRPGSRWLAVELNQRSEGPLWDEGELISFLVTNQPLYRPGQKVSLAGWLRGAPRWVGVEEELSEDLAVRMTVTDETGLVVWSGQKKLDDFGGFTGEFQLGDEVVLGNYEVKLKVCEPVNDPFVEEGDDVSQWVPSGRPLWNARWNFEVGEFRKPDFEVSVEGGMVEEGWEAVVEAKYLSGEPVKGAAVVVLLKAQPSVLELFPKRRWDDLYGAGYEFGLPVPVQFSDWEKWAMVAEYCQRGDEDWERFSFDEEAFQEVYKMEATTDEEGRARVIFDPEFSLLKDEPYRVELRAEVKEFTGRQVSAEKSVLHTGREFEVFARPLRGFYEAGEQVKVEVGALTAAGEKVSAKGRLRLERRVAGEFEVVLEREVVLGESGEAVVSFAAPAGGQYRCFFEGGGSERGFVLEVLEEGAEGGNYGGVQVIPREFMMKPDEVAEFLILTDEPAAAVWLFESYPNGLRKSPRVVRTRNHRAVVGIPVGRSGQPGFVVEAVAFLKGQQTRSRAFVLMPNEGSRLEVGLSLDEEVGEPGGKAGVSVKVRDGFGEARKAALAMTVFDRALENLSGSLPVTDEMRKVFRGHPRALTSMGSWGEEEQDIFDEYDEAGIFAARYLLASRVAREKASRFVKVGEGVYPTPGPWWTVGGGFGGGGGMGFPVTPANPVAGVAPELPQEAEWDEGGAVAGVAVREDFADRAYWGGALRTDDEGKLKVDFELPDNLTSWRVQSWAFGQGWAFGDGQVALPVSKDLQVRPLLPRAAVVGDELVVGGMIQNRSERAGRFLVSMEVEGGKVLGGSRREIVLDPGRDERVEWKVVLEEEGGAIFRVKAASRDGELSDGFEVRVPVAGRMAMQTVSDAVMIPKGEKVVELRLAGAKEMAGAVVQFRAESSSSLSALAVIPDLVNYPHGCVEQTLNRYFPLLIASRAVKELGLDWEEMEKLMVKRNDSLGWIRGRNAVSVAEREIDLSEKKVRELIHVGMDRLKRMQNEDGTWSWFGGGEPDGRAYLTALALRGLLESPVPEARAKTIGFRDRARYWLENWSRRNFGYGDEKELLAEAAFVAWVLSEARRDDDGNDPGARLRERLWEIREALPLTGRIYLGLAMTKRKRLDELMRGIGREMEEVDEKGWGYFSWWKQPVERRAVYLQLLVKWGAEREILEGEVRRLLEARRDGIRWRSTRESAFCLEAILDAAVASGLDSLVDESAVELEVEFAGKKEGLVLKRKMLWAGGLEFVIGDKVPKGDLVVRVKRSGNDEREVFLNAAVTYRSSDPAAMKAEEKGLAVERRYYRMMPNGERDLVKEGEGFVKGEVIEVELVIKGEEGLEFLHLRDPIPAGFEPLMSLSGYAGGAYRESRTGELNFFLTELTEWNRRQVYRVSVVTGGKSLALPSAVECMYSPEVRGRSEGRVVVSGE